MTDKEKAKAYDEALEKVKPLYGRAKKDDNPIWSTYEHLFPQLCESEGDRTRKRLIEFISDVKRISESGRNSWAVRKDDAEMCDAFLTYLEKLKDASKAIEAVDRIDKYIDEKVANAHDMKDSNPDKKYYRGWDDALSKMAGILQDVYSGEKQKETLRRMEYAFRLREDNYKEALEVFNREKEQFKERELNLAARKESVLELEATLLNKQNYLAELEAKLKAGAIPIISEKELIKIATKEGKK